MKKSILIIAALAFIGVATFTGCTNPAQKVENAEENVQEAKEDLAKARQEYLADMESYRKHNATVAHSNERKIAELKTQVARENAADRPAYLKRISELEQKNLTMRNQLADYNYDNQESWRSFKTNYSRDMDNLGRDLENFFDSK